MASSAFQPISWSPDQIIDDDLLSQVNDNTVWVYENMLQGKYVGEGGANISTSMLVVCGTVRIGKNKAGYAWQQVRFGQIFASAPRPIVTASIVGNNHILNNIFIQTAGIGGLAPSDAGFTVKVAVDIRANRKETINHQIFVDWIAMGRSRT